MGKHEKLFEPGKIGSMEVNNRVIMAPMVTHMATALGEVTDRMIEYYERRAEGGVGYITTGATMAATAIDRVKMFNTVLRADDDAFLPGLSNLAEAIHEAGTKAVVQLSLGAGAQASGPSSFIPADIPGYQNVSSSDRPSKITMRKTRALSVEEIEQLVELFAQSVLRVKRAGFDGVEIHGHGGYLLAQFLSPYFNKRSDKYGGDKDSRFLLLREIIQKTKRYVDDSYPLIFRYSIDELVEGGRTIEESKEIAVLCEEEGVHAIHVSVGVYESLPYIIPPIYISRGHLIDYSRQIKETVDIPVIVPGRINDPDLAENILKEGKADFVALGRSLIADPDWVRKAKAGEKKSIRRCIACNEGCAGNILRGWPIRCAVNATVGRERRYDNVAAAITRKKVVVIGGGPAGMEAARVSALRGHNVHLYEKSTKLGGHINTAMKPPHKQELKNIIDYFGNQFQKLKNLKVELGVEVTLDLVKKESPDVVILATGSIPFVPEIKRSEGTTLLTHRDIFEKTVALGNEVVVVGGNSIGCETSNYLSNYCSRVTIVEMNNEIAYDLNPISKMCLINELVNKNVIMLTSYKLTEVLNNGCKIMDKNWNTMFVQADTVVFAGRNKPVNNLKQDLIELVSEVYVIGDAKKPRKIIDANTEGYLTGYKI